MRKINLRIKVSAYFTVEAALVLTLVTGVIVILIYIIFFQYNRCLLEQDMGTLALKGCTVQVKDKDELLQQLNQFEKQIYRDKYIAWKWGGVILELEQDQVKVEQSGSLLFPFKGGSFFNKESEWETSIVYENRRISPVSVVRIRNKLMGGK